MPAFAFRVALAAMFLCGVASAPVRAQEDPAKFPSRTVRLIVPSSPGGPVDAVARILADALRTVWSEPVIVESKPGAGNSTGAVYVANSPPDGYTLLVISDSITVNPSLYPNLDKDPLNQFAPVSVLVTAPQVLVARADLPASDLRGFIDDAKSKPGQLNVASAGAGTISHLTEVLLEQRAGIKTAHIPFRGAAPAVTALLGKHVDAAWLMPAPLLPAIAGGQMKALAVTGAARDPKLPNVATAEEAGIADFQIMNWQGLYAPAGTPQPIVEAISRTVAGVLHTPEVRDRLAKVGFEARGDSPAVAAEQVRANVARWSKVIAAAGIKVGGAK
jgi:tripartite-type tricarboxylate transporter receptor subunit TctC